MAFTPSILLFIYKLFLYIHGGTCRSVLHVTSKDGSLFSVLVPQRGVGIEENDPERVKAQTAYSSYLFYSSIEEIPTQQFDYILLSFATMEAEDIQLLFQSLPRFCTPNSRIVLETYIIWWAPFLWLAQKLRLKRPMRYKNWLSRSDIVNIVQLADFEMFTAGGYILVPFYIPIDFLDHE